MCVGCKSMKIVPAKEPECMYLYTELRSLDLQVLDMFAKNKAPEYLEWNKKLRGWIKALKVECPPKDELNDLRYKIADEYPKYFNDI